MDRNSLNGDIEMKRNIFFISQDGYEAVLDLDKATGIQRYNNRIIIHYGHPDESLIIFDHRDEFHIINAYFETLKENRLKLIDLMRTEKNKNEEIKESIHHMRGT